MASQGFPTSLPLPPPPIIATLPPPPFGSPNSSSNNLVPGIPQPLPPPSDIDLVQEVQSLRAKIIILSNDLASAQQKFNQAKDDSLKQKRKKKSLQKELLLAKDENKKLHQMFQTLSQTQPQTVSSLGYPPAVPMPSSPSPSPTSSSDSIEEVSGSSLNGSGGKMSSSAISLPKAPIPAPLSTSFPGTSSTVNIPPANSPSSGGPNSIKRPIPGTPSPQSASSPNLTGSGGSNAAPGSSRDTKRYAVAPDLVESLNATLNASLSSTPLTSSGSFSSPNGPQFIAGAPGSAPRMVRPPGSTSSITLTMGAPPANFMNPGVPSPVSSTPPSLSFANNGAGAASISPSNPGIWNATPSSNNNSNSNISVSSSNPSVPPPSLSTPPILNSYAAPSYSLPTSLPSVIPSNPSSVKITSGPSGAGMSPSGSNSSLNGSGPTLNSSTSSGNLLAEKGPAPSLFGAPMAVLYAHDGTLRAASFDELLSMLPNSDSSYIDTFLMTYRAFCKPEDLLSKMIGMWDKATKVGVSSGSNASTENLLKVFRFKFMNVLIKWIEKHSIDFDDTLLTKIQQFVKSTHTEGYTSTTTYQKITTLVRHKLDRTSKKVLHNSELNSPAPILPSSLEMDQLDITIIDPLELARQITLMDEQAYKSIAPSECMNQAWNKPAISAEAAPNILKMIARFNGVSNWSARLLLLQSETKKRKSTLTRIIKLAQRMRELHNYHSLMAIIAALESAPVTRLKKTWEAIDSAYIKQFQELRAIMSAESSYKAYRAVIKGDDPPVIPYIGVYLADLTFIEDGNPGVLQDPIHGDLINYAKMKMLDAVIQDINMYQQQVYKLEPVPKIQALLAAEEAIKSTDKELFELSLKCEPRSTQK